MGKSVFVAGLIGAWLVLSVGASRTHAWGPSGHRIVAIVAERHLAPTAKKRIATLLNGETLPQVANWADDVRPERPQTANWHFVDVPRSAHDYLETRDCKPNPDAGDCVILAIARERGVLRDQTKSLARRAEALKFLVHFIADLHQPLHCADDNDRGGNNVDVQFFGKASKLHKVWDSGIINHADLSDREFADGLVEDLAPSDIDAIQAGSVVQWALEAHEVAVDLAYGRLPGDRKLGDKYYEDTADAVDLQLRRAGLRLAKILNESFKNGS
jgi:hypothetical protein